MLPIKLHPTYQYYSTGHRVGVQEMFYLLAFGCSETNSFSAHPISAICRTRHRLAASLPCQPHIERGALSSLGHQRDLIPCSCKHAYANRSVLFWSFALVIWEVKTGISKWKYICPKSLLNILLHILFYAKAVHFYLSNNFGGERRHVNTGKFRNSS